VQTSAAMLGLALSFGASAPLLTEPELALAADGANVTVLPAANREQGQATKLVPVQEATSSAYHTVEPGESLWRIAAQHEADVQSIKAANGIVADEVLRVGQVIRVPAVGMANLTAAADVSRLALKTGLSGGVGGDLGATSGPLPNGDALSVDELEKAWELDETLTLDEALSLGDQEELSKDRLTDSALDQLVVSGSDVDAQLEATKAALVPTSDQDTAAKTEDSWLVADAQVAQPASPQLARLEAATPQAAAEDAQASALQASLPLHEEGQLPVASAPAAPVAETDSNAQAADSKKDLTLAALPLRSASAGAMTESSILRSYQVKPGDTLWSIATRNGVTLDELLTHNRTVAQPEALSVGDSISIPTASAVDAVAEVDEPAEVPANALASAPKTREQAIRDHLARIRESNSARVDRDELNARIREARQELDRSRTGASNQAAVALEYHAPEPVALASARVGGAEPASATALAVREGAQTTASQWTVTDAAKDESQTVAALGPVVESPVGVSVQPVPESPAQADLLPSGSEPIPSQLLAAAPLGADAYQVAPRMPVGQTVSPNMPMMPGANEFLPEAPRVSNGFVWPTQGILTSGYGWRWGRMHRGIDIAGPVGTPIVAAAPGVVVRSGWNSGGYGNLVDVRHADGSMTRYAHNSRLLVREGEQVRQGQQIAEMGSTGYSTGPHLHFEVHLPGSGASNPMAFLPGR